MSWLWRYETGDGTSIGTSPSFDSRGDAETWLGESFDELLDDGVEQVMLLEDDNEIYGPMALSAETPE